LRQLPNGRNKRAVWRINPQPFKSAHFAVFPEKLVEPMILAGCPPEICDKCGTPYKPDFEYRTIERPDLPEDDPRYRPHKYDTTGKNADNPNKARRYCDTQFHGYKTMCDHNTTTHPGIVLDPFAGSGTTCLVARKLDRHYIGIDLNPDYCDMAEKRIKEIL
jgi:DNA modification methylase